MALQIHQSTAYKSSSPRTYPLESVAPANADLTFEAHQMVVFRLRIRTRRQHAIVAPRRLPKRLWPLTVQLQALMPPSVAQKYVLIMAVLMGPLMRRYYTPGSMLLWTQGRGQHPSLQSRSKCEGA